MATAAERLRRVIRQRTSATSTIAYFRIHPRAAHFAIVSDAPKPLWRRSVATATKAENLWSYAKADKSF